MPRLLPTLAAIASALLIVAGCGGGSGALDPADEVTVASFRADVAMTVLDGSAYGALLDSSDQVIALAREDPDATYSMGDGDQPITMRQVLSDAASELQPYQPDLADKLDRAVETLD